MRTLAVRLDGPGDVLLAGPAIRSLAVAGPVTLLASPRGRAAATLLPGVEEVLTYAAPWIDPDGVPVERVTTERLVESVAAREFDRAVVLTSPPQSALPTALVLRLAGIRQIAAISEDDPGTLLDVRAPDPGDVHEVERSLALTERLGAFLPDGDDGALRVTLPERDVHPFGGRPYVVVHPGASVPARTWSPDLSADLVAALTARGRNVAVTGGPGEVGLTAHVAGRAALDLGGRTDFEEFALVLARADAVVVGDAGPAHLAAAVGTPVVSLFAPTVPVARRRPWRVPHVLLGAQDVPCAGCRARACPVLGHPCLSRITVLDVLAAVEALAPGLAVAG